MSSALQSAIPTISSIICIAWIPGAFVAAFFLAGKMGVNGGMRIFLTFILGGILWSPESLQWLPAAPHSFR